MDSACYATPFYETLLAINKEISGIVLSKDESKFLLNGFSDKKVTLYSLKGNRTNELNYIQTDAFITYAGFSEDQTNIITATMDDKIQLWTLNGKLTQSIDSTGKYANYVIEAPGNTLLAACSDGLVRHLNWQGKILQFFAHDTTVLSVQLSPDTCYILTASWDRTALLWDWDGDLIETFRHNDYVRRAYFLDNGKKIITCSKNSEIREWETETGRLINIFKGHKDYVRELAVSKNGQYLLSASDDKSIKLWNKDTLISTLNGHEGSVRSIYFIRNDSCVLSASENGAVKLWHLQKDPFIQFNHPASVSSVEFSKDGKYLVTACDDGIARIWDLDGNILADYKGHQSYLNHAVFSNSGNHIATASADASAIVWDIKEGKEVGQFYIDTLNPHKTNWVSSIRFSPEGQQLLIAAWNGQLSIWNPFLNESYNLIMQEQGFSFAKFVKNGTGVLTSDFAGKTQFSNIKGDRLFAKQYDNTHALSSDVSKNEDVLGMAFSTQGAKLINLHTNIVTTLAGLQEAKVKRIRFAHTKDMVLTASDSGLLAVWDFKGSKLFDFKLDNIPLNDAAFSPDDNIIALAYKDGKVILVNINQYELLSKVK